MQVYMPELREIEKLEREMDSAKTPSEYAKAEARYNFLFQKLRRVVEQKQEED